jgi:hypothetical protein
MGTEMSRGCRHFNMQWKTIEVKELQSMIEAGLTAKEVGKAMGRSKNSIIGAAHRLGIKWPAKPEKAKIEKEPRKRCRRQQNISIVINPAPKKEEVMKPATDGVPITELNYRSCRAIVASVGGPMGTALYCGEITEESVSFCDYHCSIYYQPRGVKHDDRQRTNKAR